MNISIDASTIISELKLIGLTTALTQQKCEETDRSFNQFVSEFRVTTKGIQEDIYDKAQDLQRVHYELNSHGERLGKIDEWIDDHSEETTGYKLSSATKEGKFEAYKAVIIGVSAIAGSLATTLISYILKHI